MSTLKNPGKLTVSLLALIIATQQAHGRPVVIDTQYDRGYTEEKPSNASKSVDPHPVVKEGPKPSDAVLNDPRYWELGHAQVYEIKPQADDEFMTDPDEDAANNTASASTPTTQNGNQGLPDPSVPGTIFDPNFPNQGQTNPTDPCAQYRNNSPYIDPSYPNVGGVGGSVPNQNPPNYQRETQNGQVRMGDPTFGDQCLPQNQQDSPFGNRMRNDPITELSVQGMGFGDWIGLGMLAYNIVQSNQPQVLAEVARLSVFPNSKEEWTNMTGWTKPTKRMFHIELRNSLGMKTVQLDFLVTYSARGSLAGKGKYVANLMIRPVNVQVGWGHKFDVRFAAGDFINMGTKENPVVGIDFDVQYRVHTMLKRTQGVKSFFLQGDGKLEVIN